MPQEEPDYNKSPDNFLWMSVRASIPISIIIGTIISLYWINIRACFPLKDTFIPAEWWWHVGGKFYVNAVYFFVLPPVFVFSALFSIILVRYYLLRQNTDDMEKRRPIRILGFISRKFLWISLGLALFVISIEITRTWWSRIVIFDRCLGISHPSAKIKRWTIRRMSDDGQLGDIFIPILRNVDQIDEQGLNHELAHYVGWQTGTIPDERKKEILERIRKTLSGFCPGGKEWAFDYLFYWDGLADLDKWKIKLKEVLCEDNNPEIRASAAGVLGRLEDPEYLGCLIKALQSDKSIGVRATVAVALADLGDNRAVSSLIAALNDEEARRVRESIAYALAFLNSVDIDKALIKAREKGNKAAAYSLVWRRGCDYFDFPKMTYDLPMKEWHLNELYYHAAAKWGEVGQVNEGVGFNGLLSAPEYDRIRRRIAKEILSRMPPEFPQPKWHKNYIGSRSYQDKRMLDWMKKNGSYIRWDKRKRKYYLKKK